jgi:hypothetical protein
MGVVLDEMEPQPWPFKRPWSLTGHWWRSRNDVMNSLFSNACVCGGVWKHTHTYRQTHTHTHIPTDRPTHTHTHTRMPTNSHLDPHSNIYTYTHTHTHIHTHACTHTHTQTCTLTETRTHTPTCEQARWSYSLQRSSHSFSLVCWQLTIQHDGARLTWSMV